MIVWQVGWYVVGGYVVVASLVVGWLSGRGECGW